MNPGFFDWITPMLSLGGRARGIVTGVKLSADDERATRSILSHAGIKVHNGFCVNGYFVFDVAVDDIETVRELLGIN